MSNSRPLVYIAYMSDRLHVAQILACIAQHKQQNAELVDITDCPQ